MDQVNGCFYLAGVWKVGRRRQLHETIWMVGPFRYSAWDGWLR